MKIKKLDRRMSGYGNFEYKIQLIRSYDYKKFFEFRNWCWSQWGPSCELEFWNDTNPSWCWEVSEYNLRIYFRTSKEAQWFSLKWC